MRKLARILASTLLILIAAGRSEAVTFYEWAYGQPGGKGIAVDPEGWLWRTWGGAIDGDSLHGAGQGGGVGSAVNLVDMIAGPDSLWMTEPSTNTIWRYRYIDNVATQYHPPTANSQPMELTIGPDGAIWFTEWAGNRIGRVTPEGAFTEYPLPNPGSQPKGITTVGDGNIWFTEYNGNRIGRITTNGQITEFPLASPASYPSGIAGTRHTVAVTENGLGKIALIHLYDTSTVHEYAVPTASPSLQDIVYGNDGWFYFSEILGNKIGRVSEYTSAIEEFPIPTPDAGARALAVGRDGSIFFVEEKVGGYGRLYLSRPGDVNADGKVDVADVFYLINFLFAGGGAPK